jgi:hypothetical protein
MTFDEWWKKEYAKLHAYDAAKKAWYAAIDQAIFQQQRLPEPRNEPPAVRDHQGPKAVS